MYYSKKRVKPEKRNWGKREIRDKVRSFSRDGSLTFMGHDTCIVNMKMYTHKHKTHHTYT